MNDLPLPGTPARLLWMWREFRLPLALCALYIAILYGGQQALHAMMR